jgi:nucleoid DNA-binding protein
MCTTPIILVSSAQTITPFFFPSSTIAGGRASFPGFGTFSSRRRAARTGLNPQTKETLNIPAKTVPVFKAGKKFTDSVAGK